MRLLFSLFALLFSVAAFAQELVVFSTGDLHGNISGKGRCLEALVPAVNEIRAKSKTSPVFIDAGDICKGWGSAETLSTGGKLAFDILSYLKYDVFVPGNHELELGEDGFRKMASGFTGRILAANMPTEDFSGSCIIERDNIKIGIIGIAHGGIGMMKKRAFDKKFQMISEVKAISNELAKLKKAGATVFILVRHYGIHTVDKEFVSKFPELALIINAHSHKNAVKKIGNTLCVQSFSPNAAVSTLTVENGKVVASSGRLLKLEPEKKLDEAGRKFFKEKVYPLTEQAGKEFAGTPRAENREEFIFEVLKKNIKADIYLIRTRTSSASHFSKQLNMSKLSSLYSYLDKAGCLEFSADKLTECLPELKKTGTLVLDEKGKPAKISGGKTLRVAATDQIFFDIRMKKFFAEVSRNADKIKYPSSDTFLSMLKEHLSRADRDNKAQKNVKNSSRSVEKGGVSLESVKFFFDGKEYKDKFSLKKKGKFQVKCELVVNVPDPAKVEFCNFKKPLMMTKWLLNGQRIDRNGNDIFSNDITGIDGKLFKQGRNTLSCEAEIWVGRMPIGHGRPPAASYSSRSFVFKCVKAEDAKFIRGPIAGYGLTDRLSFSAFTDLPCKVELDFDGKKIISKEEFFHQFEVKDLKPDTVYSYTMTLDCRGKKKSTKKFTIKTLPATGKIRFAVLGDSQGKPECWRRIMAEAAKHKPDFLLHVGDLTSEGNQFDYWELWDFDGVRVHQAQFPRFLAKGNHERRSSLVTKLVCMANGMPSQIYQVRNDFKLIVLGFNRYGNPNNAKRYCAELDKALKNAPEKFIFFAGHGPAWSSGKHGNYKHSQRVIKVLEKNKVQAFFSGHDHSYSRSEPGNGTTQIVAASTSSMPYKPLKAHLNPHQKVFHSKMNYVIVDCLDDKAVFTSYGFDLDKDNLPVNMHVIDSGSWDIRKVKEKSK